MVYADSMLNARFSTMYHHVVACQVTLVNHFTVVIQSHRRLQYACLYQQIHANQIHVDHTVNVELHPVLLSAPAYQNSLDLHHLADQSASLVANVHLTRAVTTRSVLTLALDHVLLLQLAKLSIIVLSAHVPPEPLGIHLQAVALKSRRHHICHRLRQIPAFHHLAVSLRNVENWPPVNQLVHACQVISEDPQTVGLSVLQMMSVPITLPVFSKNAVTHVLELVDRMLSAEQ